MRISPVNFNANATKQNFNGILVETRSETTDLASYETTLSEWEHDYYPFKDETQEEIEKAIAPYNKVERTTRPYPLWNDEIIYTTKVRAPLDLTLAQYNGLKKAGLSNAQILDIYR